MRRALLLAAAAALLPASVTAQMAPPSGRTPPPVPGPAQTCVACHGPMGAGNQAGGIPRIAGLTQYYSTKQLRSYLDGTRQNAQMEAIARSLSEEDIAVVTAYFAQVDAPAVRAPIPTAPVESNALGRQLAEIGSSNLGVQACNSCHGPGGAGEPPAIPQLAGQDAYYMITTLNAWQAGIRRNDAGAQMTMIARALTPEAIVAVARHYARLPPPPPIPLNQVSPLPSPAERLAALKDRVVAVEAAPATAAITAPRLSPLEWNAADPARGQRILLSAQHGCTGCHTIPGVRGANGIAGPSLAGMARRAFIAGQLPNRADILVAFLQDPPALVPDTGMPNTGLTREEALHVAAYLNTLER